jgi:hypothetical protein
MIEHADPIKTLERPQLVLPGEAPGYPAPCRDMAKASSEDVAQCGASANEIELLENDSDVTPLSTSEVSCVGAKDVNVPLGGSDKASYAAEQGRLPSPARPEHRDELSGMDPKAHAGDRRGAAK